jgi:hypothetical protein
MPAFYNPIVRTFCRLRASLARHLDIDPRHVAPCIPLEALIPVERRRLIWQRLRGDGLDVPALELVAWERTVGAFTVLKTTAFIALAMKSGFGLFSALPLSALAYGVTRPRAVQIPLGIRTVGELVMYCTSYRDHQASGYRWSRGDIAYRVRFVVAEALALDLDQVQEHRSFLDLAAE